ncbi:MAG: hypothetical protein Q9201_005056 [Fulgogasparrea decipioides]
MPRSKRSLPCLASPCAKSFRSISAIFTHLESGNCTSGITVQDLNTLISRSPAARSIILSDRDPWFRAGPPRTEAQARQDWDDLMQLWRCPYCSFSSWGKNDLDKHLRSSFCTTGYPNTLRCPKCGKEFVTMSKLMTHVGDKPQCKLKSGEDDVFRPLVLHLEKQLAAWNASVKEQRVQYRLLSEPWMPGGMTVQVIESELEQSSIPHISSNGNLTDATSDVVHKAEVIRVDDAELENALETLRSENILSGYDLDSNHATPATSSHVRENRRWDGHRISKSFSTPDRSGSIQLESPASDVALAPTPTLGDALQTLKCGNAISDHSLDASNHIISRHGHGSRLLGDYGISKIYPTTDESGGSQQEIRASDAAFTPMGDLALEALGSGNEKNGETQASFSLTAFSRARGNRAFDGSGAFLHSFRDGADTHDGSLDSEIVFSGRGRGQGCPRRDDDGCSSSEARDEDASDGGVGI